MAELRFPDRSDLRACSFPDLLLHDFQKGVQHVQEAVLRRGHLNLLDEELHAHQFGEAKGVRVQVRAVRVHQYPRDQLGAVASLLHRFVSEQ